MPVVKTGAVSYRSKNPEKCLVTAKQEKKRKYINNYLNKWKHFTPLIDSADVLFGVEAEATLKCIAIHLSQKWGKPYSFTCG